MDIAGSIMPPPRKLPRLVDALWLGALALYILAGAAIVPFHGDESTLMFMGRDYHYIFYVVTSRRLFSIENFAARRAENTLRMLNGTVSKTRIGWVMASNGRSLIDYNSMWDWHSSYEQNQDSNAIPDVDLLRQARLASALQLALAAAAFHILVSMTLNRPTAYLASALFMFCIRTY